MKIKPPRIAGYTLLEIVATTAIIFVLAALVFSGGAYLRDRQKRDRAAMEIAALAAALEDYKVEMGVYPQNDITDNLDTKNSFDPATYKDASLFLYQELSGDRNRDGHVDEQDKNEGEVEYPKTFFHFKKEMLHQENGNILGLKDPFGNNYGYSTIGESHPEKGFNPTFDLWSTAGTKKDSSYWIKNW